MKYEICVSNAKNDKSYMNFLKTMIGSEQITEQDAKFLRRQKDSIIAEINSGKKDNYDED